MTALDPVSARWAGALFNLARKAGAVEAVGGDLQRLQGELEHPKVRDFLLGARSGQADRRAKLQPLLDSFHPLTKNFVQLALDRRREGILPHVAEAFRRRALAEERVVEGVVETARALGSSEISALEASLGKRLGSRVRLSQRVNDSLVAGVRIFVGTRMIDQSVQGRLETLRRRLESAQLPAGV